ncbi:uncharacterized protein BT62DRAFT_999320 [Guyanagaster necrorhizus]|uniref:Uncharacterized protein n=1 Tax=Guyanagaster necrorhizus TaxID=856835 RepID=A0A9P7W629_9AGAR|nr:uncharacterized protein BT62DRAFT_999320 [Guyanagaster necrorhizus MCA 3950]KAG7453264.1 hypothetical protein BT62DRAFT_999320 [Guyanagaster necrorhizus MCA 3950]
MTQVTTTPSMLQVDDYYVNFRRIPGLWIYNWNASKLPPSALIFSPQKRRLSIFPQGSRQSPCSPETLQEIFVHSLPDDHNVVVLSKQSSLLLTYIRKE